MWRPYSLWHWKKPEDPLPVLERDEPFSLSAIAEENKKSAELYQRSSWWQMFSAVLEVLMIPFRL